MKTLMILALMSTMTIAVNGGSILNFSNANNEMHSETESYDSLLATEILHASVPAASTYFTDNLWFEAMNNEPLLLQTNLMEGRDILHIIVELSEIQGGLVEIKNEHGKVVWSTMIPENEIALEFYLDLNRLPKGHYTVEASQVTSVFSPVFEVE